MQDIRSALGRIEKAVAREPNNPKWLLQKLQCQLALKDKLFANNTADTLLSLPLSSFGSSFRECADFALALNALQRYQDALHYYQIALDNTANPQQKSQILFNLASVHRYLGDLDTALQRLDESLAIQPDDAEAQLLRSSLRAQTSEQNHIEQLSQLFKQAANKPLQTAQFGYALFKELEDLKRYSEAFEILGIAAKSRRKYMRYQVEQDVETLRTIVETFDAEFALETQSKGYPSEEPIFILGLPRTGSTLVERILSQHSDVFAAGELNDFALQMMEQVKREKPESPKHKLALIAATRNLDFQQLGQNYIQATRPETGQTKHFIDKLPLNSLYVGLIKAALPNAKIIYVKRHPLDTCFAMYKQLFTNGYPFSYDLNELAEYYLAHHQMMQHWQQLYGDAIYTIEYENVVSHLEQEVKSLLTYCGLDWQSTCIDFEHNTQPSTTASASQVRQKVYASSKGKWRHYAKQLAPLKQQLEQAGIHCD